jgi:hypothetical protein
VIVSLVGFVFAAIAFEDGVGAFVCMHVAWEDEWHSMLQDQRVKIFKIDVERHDLSKGAVGDAVASWGISAY